MEDRKVNEEHYLQIIQVLDPDLYLIKMALEETGVNASILPRIIRVLGNMNIGTGFGEITILMRERTVTQIKANESDILNMKVDNQS
jgi:hypothetical protein